MKLTILGCGDAFGSGGRLQTCYHVSGSGDAFLIDCGATSLMGMERKGLDPNSVGRILISHLHGDHFSGLVWWLLHATHVAKRTKPLEVIGPPGLEKRFQQTAEALFPGSTEQPPRFEMGFVEQRAGERLTRDGGAFAVTPYEVRHPSGAPSHALRIENGGKTIAFSGDTEWVDPLQPCASGADLFLCECYAYEQATRYHMCWKILREKLPAIAARKVVLTHMSGEMLANLGKVLSGAPAVGAAEDGLVIDF